ncbi:MAG: nitroreductase family protein [Candidatus Omnitrophota bacterium]
MTEVVVDFWEVVKNRRSVRKFKKEDVSQDKIEKILKAAYLAPCGSNVKNWHVIVVRDAKIKTEMREAVEAKIKELAEKMRSPRAKIEFLAYGKYFTFFSQAPVVIAVIMKEYDSLSARILKRYEENSDYMSTAGVQNVSAAIENMLLACADLGLGACWMTGPMIAKKGLEKVLGIKGEDDLLALVPVGIPERSPSPKKMPGSIADIITSV